MVVYWEYAFAENFMLDFVLLFLSLKCARARASPFRLVFSALAGAAEAVLFPLLTLPVWAAYILKFLGGALLVVIALPAKCSVKCGLVAGTAFFFLTFALGGLLVAVYSFFGVAYQEGSGYLVESAPVGLVLGAAGFFLIAVVWAARGFYRYKRVASSVVAVKLTHRGKTVVWKGFADSGNCLSYRGEPVCVMPARAALALFHEEKAPVGRMRIGTVTGGKETAVYKCDRMEIGRSVFRNVLFTVGEVRSREYTIILHTSFVEGDHENYGASAGVAAENRK